MSGGNGFDHDADLTISYLAGIEVGKAQCAEDAARWEFIRTTAFAEWRPFALNAVWSAEKANALVDKARGAK